MADRLMLLWDHFGAWQGFDAPKPLNLLNRERVRVRRWLGRPRIWSLVSRYAEALQAQGLLDRATIFRILDEHCAPSGQASLGFWSSPALGWSTTGETEADRGVAVAPGSECPVSVEQAA